MLVEELVFSRESLHPIWDVPHDHVAYLPVPLHLTPNRGNVFPVLIDDDVKVVFCRALKVLHPELCEVVGERVGFEVASVALCSETRHRFTVFLFPAQVVEDVRRIRETHVSPLATHEFFHITWDSAVATHETAAVEVVDIAFLDADFVDLQFLELFLKVKLLWRVFDFEDLIKLFAGESDTREEFLIECRQEVEIKLADVFVETDVKGFLFGNIGNI